MKIRFLTPVQHNAELYAPGVVGDLPKKAAQVLIDCGAAEHFEPLWAKAEAESKAKALAEAEAEALKAKALAEVEAEALKAKALAEAHAQGTLS